MTYKLQKNLLLFFISSFIFFLCNICFSQINESPKEIEIFVAPAIFDLQLGKEQTYNGKILLQNKNNFVLPIKTKFTNFDAKNEFGGISYQKGKSTDWFSLKRIDFLLEPNERRIIDFKIKIPKNVSRGGYYVKWIFEPQLTVSDKIKTVVISRVNVLFLISVGKEGKANFEILETGVADRARYSFLEKIFKKDFVLNSANFPFDFRVKNNDIYHIRPQGTLEVFKGGKSIGRVDVKETTVLPNKIRKMSLDFKPSSKLLSSFYFGRYKAVLKLRVSGVTREKETEIFILPWKGIIFIKILLILILVYLIIMKREKRRKKLFRKRSNIKSNPKTAKK